MHKRLRKKTEAYKSRYRTVKHRLAKDYSCYNTNPFINFLRIPSFALQKKAMRTNLLLSIIAVISLGSCSKKDKGSGYQNPVIQLQQVELEAHQMSFQYNSANQLSRVEQKEKTESGAWETTQYTNFIYQNGSLQKAEYFLRSGTDYYKGRELKYHLDGQNRIAYIARTFFHKNGNVNRKDTVEYTFNMYNKLVGIEFSDENYHVYKYDAQGNFTPDNEVIHEENEEGTISYEFRYDTQLNPFSVNGLGLYLFSVYMDDPFTLNQLLSDHNPVLEKTIINIREFGAGGETLLEAQNSYTTEYTNSFDANGGLKLVGMDFHYQRKENGKIVADFTEQSQMKATCVKK